MGDCILELIIANEKECGQIGPDVKEVTWTLLLNPMWKHQISYKPQLEKDAYES